MRRIVVAVIPLALTAAACGSGQGTPAPSGVFNDTEAFEIETDHGRMLCVVWSGYQKGGLSCTPLGWDPVEAVR